MWNNKTSDIKLAFLYSTIKMMHDTINFWFLNYNFYFKKHKNRSRFMTCLFTLQYTLNSSACIWTLVTTKLCVVLHLTLFAFPKISTVFLTISYCAGLRRVTLYSSLEVSRHPRVLMLSVRNINKYFAPWICVCNFIPKIR
jgi:hypothetical protein